MVDRKQQLGTLVKAMREQSGVTQEQLAKDLNIDNRSIVAHLEQGIRIPQPSILQTVCNALKIPLPYYEAFIDPEWSKVADFEEALNELTGSVTFDLSRLDDSAQQVARESIVGLFNASLTNRQALEWLNSILVHYNVRPLVSPQFFSKYLGNHVLKSPQKFIDAVRHYQTDAIRLFNSFQTAYEQLNTTLNLDETLELLKKQAGESFFERSDWTDIESIPTAQLQGLGYIAAAELKKEENERLALCSFLQQLADAIEKDGKDQALSKFTERKRRSMDSLLRKFNSTLPHGVFSPLFITDSDRLRREAKSLAPRNEQDLKIIQETQAKGLRNLARYVSADHLDIYVATSMRVDADFVSVNQFVTALFRHQDISRFKLRYFNPTQSWIQDRVAKGLVEALMLRRARMTIYMAQREDSFGKDSEASVALGQGKPVIVYVPKLTDRLNKIDSERLGRSSRSELITILSNEGTADDSDIDETIDDLGLLSRIFEIRLSKMTPLELAEIAVDHWADFGLNTESATDRIHLEHSRAAFRSWVDSLKSEGKPVHIPSELREDFIKILVSTATNFEKRSRLFREQHPLALQVILQSGVLNGMIVVRSIDSCARIIQKLLLNDLELELSVDSQNYTLIEQTTKSTIRVISRHPLITSAFATYYSKSGTALPQ
ncbi:MAG TPA: helix-turn-helix transcriptional regulator [Oculatellaceae cyanobacterium]